MSRWQLFPSDVTLLPLPCARAAHRPTERPRHPANRRTRQPLYTRDLARIRIGDGARPADRPAPLRPSLTRHSFISRRVFSLTLASPARAPSSAPSRVKDNWLEGLCRAVMLVLDSRAGSY